ncbi:winged helix-turn-helix transcriptional regulator [Streptomyces sp. NPDC088354]|uniref:winged helix-turn-helix transcriptional regulator n=1 Tax=unclassified Streptomyces TaxID=2593676 RepID=UPI0029B1435D|nr:helix-turn-helix domain-containing protein [Streptomyces sp. MI02-7b]MDX3075499.1 helix-turn-helix domain-containing protein [Streptomyces sp. MI02-7b]
MTLPSTYPDSNCSLARALEVIGERWTLLIVRDAFYGVSRFGDLATQLGIPRAVLTNRLKLLVREGVLTRDDDGAGSVGYRLTDKGIALWPIVRAMMAWGDAFYSPAGVKRALRHDVDGGPLDHEGRCQACGSVAAVPEIRIEPGPGFDAAADSARDPVSALLNGPRRLLEPVTASRTRPSGEPGEPRGTTVAQ